MVGCLRLQSIDQAYKSSPVKALGSVGELLVMFSFEFRCLCGTILFIYKKPGHRFIALRPMALLCLFTLPVHIKYMLIKGYFNLKILLLI